MISIAIDGPAGAGKSTIAKTVAQKLGFIYVDTGALYRAIGLYVVRKGKSPKDEDAVASLLPQLQIELCHQDGAQRVLLCGEDVSEDIRLPEISMAASDVSSQPAVRLFLLELQRDLAKQHNVIMDGRDIGTVVLPHADIKIFLTASPQARAQRRYEELLGKQVEATYEQVLEDILQRDHQDSSRKIAPLRPAPDSILLDTSGFELHQSVALVEKTIKEQGVL